MRARVGRHRSRGEREHEDREERRERSKRKTQKLFRGQTACDRILAKYRFGEGGLLRRIEQACHLTRLPGQVLTIALLTWAPVMLFGLLSEYRTGREEALLHDPAVHVRLLIATPIFIVLDRVFPIVCRNALADLSNQSFIRLSDLPRFEHVLQKVVRAADSLLPELLIAGSGLLVGYFAFRGEYPLRGIEVDAELSGAQRWYVLTDLPIFHFFLWRSLWRWALWGWLLTGISRIRLQVVPTHPDRRGGIAFLRYPSILYCTALLFAVSCVVCAEWGSRFTETQTLSSFKPLLLLFAAVGTLIAFGPLLVFTPHLVRARRQGLKQIGALAARSGRRFRRSWLRDPRPGPVRDREVEGLGATVVTYRDTLYSIHYVLWEKRDLIVLLAATLAPVLPVMLASVPKEDWAELLSLLSGGL